MFTRSFVVLVILMDKTIDHLRDRQAEDRTKLGRRSSSETFLLLHTIQVLYTAMYALWLVPKVVLSVSCSRRLRAVRSGAIQA